MLGSNTEAIKELGILQSGVGMPYLALFNEEEQPICIEDDLGNMIPLGARISKFEFKSTIKAKDTNMVTLTIQSGDSSIIDVPQLAEGSILILQWGYIYPNGNTASSPYRVVKIRDIDATFNTSGVTLTLKCIDTAAQVNQLEPFKPNTNPDDSSFNTFSKFLDEGMGNKIGIIIKRYNNG